VLIVLGIYPAWKAVEHSGLLNSPSADAAMLSAAEIDLKEDTIKADVDNNVVNNDRLSLYSNTELDQVKQELNAYVADKSSEYQEELAQINELLGNKQYDEADTLLANIRQQYPNQPALLARHAETMVNLLANHLSYWVAP